MDTSGIFKKTQIHNKKLVISDVKTIKKKQLIKYVQYLFNTYNNIFMDYGTDIEKIQSKLSKKTKSNIVDIINFSIETRDIDSSKIQVYIKGVEDIDKNLIKIKVKKTVNKIIQ